MNKNKQLIIGYAIYLDDENKEQIKLCSVDENFIYDKHFLKLKWENFINELNETYLIGWLETDIEHYIAELLYNLGYKK